MFSDHQHFSANVHVQIPLDSVSAAMKVDFKSKTGKLRAVAAKLEVAIPACERPLIANRTARVELHEPSLLSFDIDEHRLARERIGHEDARGAAYLAGYKAGVCPDPHEFSKSWQLDRRFVPAMDPAIRARKWAGWQTAVRRTLSSPG